MGRTHAFDGWPGTATPGLRGAWTAQRNAASETFCAFASCIAQKPVICRGGKSRSTYTSRPVSHIPDSKQAIHLSEEEKGALKRPHKYR